VCSEVRSAADHPFNEKNNGEIFKYRKIADKKTFQILRLPDTYQLLPSQGRSNVHKFTTLLKQVKLLADSRNEKEVCIAIRQKSDEELLGFLGSSAWESICTAYLILEEGFIPTGLLTGRTLRTLDIVGCRKSDFIHVYAQCKKTEWPTPIEPEFVNLCAGMDEKHIAYYFAYGPLQKRACTPHRCAPFFGEKSMKLRLKPVSV
jgi:hypothetical protein